MNIWIILAAGAAAAEGVLLILYRRQVRRTCRQLAFLREQKTNLRLNAELPFPELNALNDEINGLLDRMREAEREAKAGEDELKETITNLSHDIRTPLTSMDGYFQLLAQSGSGEERARYIAVIQSRIASLKGMLEELFTYTKLQNAGYELELERLDFGECVYEAVFSFYEDFKARGMEPEIDFCGERLTVMGNREGLRRMLQNIVRNAMVHGKSKIAFYMGVQEACAVFACVNDVEHPEELDAGRVFSRFYRADSARTHSSTGLGLSIARGLAERMGGRAEAALDGELFTVRILLPLERV